MFISAHRTYSTSQARSYGSHNARIIARVILSGIHLAVYAVEFVIIGGSDGMIDSNHDLRLFLI